jgi:gamma-glutamylputrescine oxidase
MLSYWERSALTHFDVIVVGSGITGLSTAISLKEKKPHLSVAVFERGVLPTGASTRNAGFACIGSVGEIADDLQHSSESEVLQLVELRWKGLQLLRKRLTDKNICYRENGSYELIADNELDVLEKVDAVNNLLKSVTSKNAFTLLSKKESERFSFSKKHTKAIIQNHCEGELHTGEMMKHLHLLALQKGIIVFTGCEVENIEAEPACTVNVKRNLNNETITFHCQKIVLCTNAFTPKFLPELDIQPGRGLVLITKPIESLSFKGIYHFDKGYYYFREIDGRVLFGGGRNEDFVSESTTNFAVNEKIYASLMEKMQHVILPSVKFEVDMCWAGIMAFGKKKKPLIEWVSENVLLAARMGGMGVAIGSMAGEVAASKVAEKI